MQDSTDPSDSLLLSPTFVGFLAWIAALVSFGHRETTGAWPAEFGGAGAAFFAVGGFALLGYGVATRVSGDRGE